MELERKEDKQQPMIKSIFVIYTNEHDYRVYKTNLPFKLQRGEYISIRGIDKKVMITNCEIDEDEFILYYAKVKHEQNIDNKVYELKIKQIENLISEFESNVKFKTKSKMEELIHSIESCIGWCY